MGRVGFIKPPDMTGLWFVSIVVELDGSSAMCPYKFVVSSKQLNFQNTYK